MKLKNRKMTNYTPPYKITSKILKLLTQISKEFTKLIFSNIEKVKSVYRFAIEKEFRLFSYGDLSVWLKN